MNFFIRLKPRFAHIEPLILEYKPAKNLVAEKYFAQIRDFLKRNEKIDKDLSYWNFALDRSQKEEYVELLQQNLDKLKICPDIQMDYKVSFDDSQKVLNEIHDKFEFHLKKILNCEIVTEHRHIVEPALLQINLLIHKLENFNSIAEQLKTRDKNFIDCAFGFRFENDIFNQLEEYDYDHFTMHRPFGQMTSGYNTTGKNIIHCMNDNDVELVHQAKLSPQKTFSTEAYFWFGATIEGETEYKRLYEWWDANNIQTYKKYDRKNSIGLIPLAELVEPPAFASLSHWEKINLLNQYSGVESVFFK